MAYIGKSVLRKEGQDKVRGAAKYIDDLTFPDMLHGVTIRSSIARGKIKNIHFDPSVNWSEYTIVTAKDIPGKNHVALIQNDQPYLVDQMINHPEEAVVLIAHPDKHQAELARTKIKIETEAMPGVFSIQDSLDKKQIIWGQDNVFKKYLVDKGNVDPVWSQAHMVVEDEYSTGAQEQLYIEPNGMVAVADKENGVTVWGSLQCPFYVHKALIDLFALPQNKIRVVQAATGGGFGGKEEYPSMIAGHTALLAWKSGKPVKMIYDRAEDMVCTTKRHPSRTKHRTAVSKEGKLLAMEIDFVIDGGAYITLSPVVLSRGTIHAAGPYECDHVRIKSQAVATNAPPHGAFRGFGAPQSLFALEKHMDVVAKKVGLTPEEFRRRNFLKTNSRTATKQLIKEKIDLPALMDLGLRNTKYFEKRKKYETSNKNGPIKRGIGFATFMHGAGFTGSGEKYLASQVGIEATEEGNIRVLAASTEIGQGTNTVFSQIVADALQISYESVEVLQPDTSKVPNSGPTVASRTCMIVGKLVESAALGLKQTLTQSGLLKTTYTDKEFRLAVLEYLKKFGTLKCVTEYKQPNDVQWNDEKYEGDAYAAFAWAIYVADISVDTRTYETRVEDFYALQEIGRVVHPLMAEGQIEGGVAQGIGYALYEKVVWKEGRMMNGQMTNYIMPTSADLGSLRVEFLENPTEHGPGGAKGIGELPMDGPGPAILNAIEMAVGKTPKFIPFLPEDMRRLLKNEKMEGRA
ncbi:MAG: xanthine dehydrogenase family protein molybdopterin-binding subunit [Bdellovibrionales bacterium]